MSATNFSFPIQRAVFQNNKGYAEMFEPENALTRSQDLPEAMHDAGQFYLFRSDAVRAEKSFSDLNVRLKLLDRAKDLSPYFLDGLFSLKDLDIISDIGESALKNFGSFSTNGGLFAYLEFEPLSETSTSHHTPQV